MAPNILVGTRKGTFAVEKHGGKWRARLLGHAGVGVNFVARDPNTGRLWALLGHGHWGAKVSVSDDQGETWQDLKQQIAYPPGARYLGQDMFEDADAEFGVGFRNVVRPATLQKLWVIGFGPDGAIYVGTIPGGLFVSRNGGKSWQLNLPLWNHASRGGDLFAGEGTGDTKWFGTPASEGVFAPGIHSIDVDPRNGKRLLIAVSTAGVLGSNDGGRTWRSRNRGMTMNHNPDPNAEWGHDPHFVQRCPGDPDHIWQQNHCGVFFSSDAAQTWRKVDAPAQGVSFGFAIATDDRDGKVAWLVPGRSDAQRITVDGSLFVARTEDGGQSWRQLRSGLPRRDAYDVVYRHALAQREGVVAFGSTTGNMFVSENRGERWQAVSHHLPPVYSVRMG
jgi:photosystem II stability/assembly factor-like uncharacterized protein